MSRGPARVLVVGPAWVGDMVMSQVLYRYLRGACPDTAIDVLAPPWSGPLLARMPEVSRAIPLPLDHGELGLRRRWRLGRALRRYNYQRAIVLPNSFKSALVPVFAAIPRRTGWRGENRFGLLNDLRHGVDRLPQMAQRFLALGPPGGAQLPELLPPRLSSDREEALAVARDKGLDAGRPLLALCPGAEFGPAKRWPPAHFAALARIYVERGWQVVLLGAAGDRAVCAAVCNDLPGAGPAHGHCHNLAGGTTLAEAVDLLSLAHAVVSNDSGLMHIAAALERPLVAVYGPTSPAFTPPLGGSGTWLASALDCAPCGARECPLGHHRCMREIAPEQAVAALDDVLAARGTGR